VRIPRGLRVGDCLLSLDEIPLSDAHSDLARSELFLALFGRSRLGSRVPAEFIALRSKLGLGFGRGVNLLLQLGQPLPARLRVGDQGDQA
jgi:hypothetical protein